MRLQRRIYRRRLCVHIGTQLQQHAKPLWLQCSVYIDVKWMEMYLQSRWALERNLFRKIFGLKQHIKARKWNQQRHFRSLEQRQSTDKSIRASRVHRAPRSRSSGERWNFATKFSSPEVWSTTPENMELGDRRTSQHNSWEIWTFTCATWCLCTSCPSSGATNKNLPLNFIFCYS